MGSPTPPSSLPPSLPPFLPACLPPRLTLCTLGGVSRKPVSLFLLSQLVAASNEYLCTPAITSLFEVKCTSEYCVRSAVAVGRGLPTLSSSWAFNYRENFVVKVGAPSRIENWTLSFEPDVELEVELEFEIELVT